MLLVTAVGIPLRTSRAVKRIFREEVTKALTILPCLDLTAIDIDIQLSNKKVATDGNRIIVFIHKMFDGYTWPPEIDERVAQTIIRLTEKHFIFSLTEIRMFEFHETKGVQASTRMNRLREVTVEKCFSAKNFERAGCETLHYQGRIVNACHNGAEFRENGREVRRPVINILDCELAGRRGFERVYNLGEKSLDIMSRILALYGVQF